MTTEAVPAGLPRPRNSAGLPVPWIVADPERLGERDDKRTRRCAGGTLCQVCGLHFDGERAFLFASPPSDDELGLPPAIGEALPLGVGVHAMDHGLLHRSCARLALTYCPGLRDARAKDELLAFSVPAGSIEAFGQDAIRVGLESLS